MVSTAAFHARVRGSFPGLGGLKETPHPLVKLSIVGRLREGSVLGLRPLGSSVWRAVSSDSSHHPQDILLAQFSLYVHKSGPKLDSFHCIYTCLITTIFSAKQEQFKSIP